MQGRIFKNITQRISSIQHSLTSELNINTNECPKAWVQNVPIITFQVLVDVITIQTPKIRRKTTTMIDIVYPITN